MVNLTTTLEKAQKASWWLNSLLKVRSHTAGEEVLLQVEVEMCEVTLGTEADNKLKVVLL